MYDEFERAVTGKPKRGMPFWGWALIAFAFFVVLGVVGIGYAVNRAYHAAADRVEELAREFALQPSSAAAEVVSRLASHAQLISADPREGLAFLEDLRPGVPSEAYMERLAEGVFDLQAAEAQLRTEVREGRDGGTVTLNSDKGSVRLEFSRNDDGGSLVIDSDEGQVRLDLVRTEDGGFLTIDSEDGQQVRMDLVKTEDGGYFSIDSQDGNVRFDLTRGEEGGQLVVRSDDQTLRFGLGDDAEAMPGWVPRVDGMPDAPRRVYSLDTAEGFLGAVAWEHDAAPEEVLTFYQERLEREGYEFKASHRLHTDQTEGGSLWARNEGAGRMVFVVAHTDDQGRTGVLLGYGQGSG
jgi:hypothetical protein